MPESANNEGHEPLDKNISNTKAAKSTGGETGENKISPEEQALFNLSAQMTHEESRREHWNDYVTLAISAYREPLRAFILAKCHDPEMTEDILQDSFEKLTRSSDKLVLSNIKSWLFTVARNRMVDIFRRHNSETTAFSGLPISGDKDAVLLQKRDPNPLPEEVTLNGERRANLKEAIMSLPKEIREAMVLRYEHDLSPTEIADLLKIPGSTVRTRLMRGRRRLREVLLADYYDPEEKKS